MKKTIITVFALVLYCTVSIGQDTCRNDYRIKTLPFQYIFNDYSFTFEKAINLRRTIGLTLGFRPSTKNEAEISSWGLFGSYTLQNFWNPLYNALTVGLNSKCYFSKTNKMFIDGNLFYRLWWFDKKTVFMTI